jgi:hypothetical protein
MLTSIAFSYLASGPTIDVSIPEDMAGLPILDAPVVSGHGARSFTFTPEPAAASLTAGMADEGDIIQSGQDRTGRPVVIYLRHSPPTTWWLRWPLANGCLTSHLRGEDGVEPWTPALRGIEIDTSAETPLLLLYDPVRPGISRFPGYQESAVWRAPVRSEHLVLIRPGFLDEGNAVESVEGELHRVRVGARLGVEVQLSAVASTDELVETATQIAASVSMSASV